jgi:hypothetical protein
MKFLMACAVILILALTAYVVNKPGQVSIAPSEVYHVSEAKRRFVESETKRRPERFEAMKWTPDAAMRMPASGAK